MQDCASGDDDEGACEANQAAFDAQLEQAIVRFADPRLDALRTTSLHSLLLRHDPSFTPSRFGSPELVFLLRNSRFLKSHRGRWAFVRQYDPERDSVTIKLEAYKYREAPAQDVATRVLPLRHNVVRPFT